MGSDRLCHRIWGETGQNTEADGSSVRLGLAPGLPVWSWQPPVQRERHSGPDLHLVCHFPQVSALSGTDLLVPSLWQGPGLCWGLTGGRTAQGSREDGFRTVTSGGRVQQAKRRLAVAQASKKQKWTSGGTQGCGLPTAPLLACAGEGAPRVHDSHETTPPPSAAQVPEDSRQAGLLRRMAQGCMGRCAWGRTTQLVEGVAKCLPAEPSTRKPPAQMGAERPGGASSQHLPGSERSAQAAGRLTSGRFQDDANSGVRRQAAF